LFRSGPLPPSGPPLHKTAALSPPPEVSLSLSPNGAAFRFPPHLFRLRCSCLCVWASTNGRTLHTAPFRPSDKTDAPHATLLKPSATLRGQKVLVSVFVMAPFFKTDAAHVSPYAACCSARFFTVPLPAVTGRFIPGDEEHGPRQRTGLSTNAPAFAVMAPARREETTVSSKPGSARGEASGIRRDTDGDYQKKAYEKQNFR